MTRSEISKIVAMVLAVAWLFVVVVVYFVVHKPFTGENALALLDAFANLAVAAAIFFLALILGRRATRTFEFASQLEAICLRAGLGLGLLSFATFGLGLLGLLNSIFFWALFLIAAFFLRDEFFATLHDFRGWRAPISSRFDAALAAFIAATLLIALTFALTPPIAWDAQTYHLVKAKQAIELGRIAPPPDILYFSFPSLVEMLYLAAMILKGDIAAQLIHFGYLLLTLGIVFVFAERFFTSRVAWVAAALLLAAPSLVLISTWAYVDLALAFYATAALYAMLNARVDSRWMGWAGAFTGLAMGVKYTAAILPLALLLAVADWLLRTRPSQLVLKYLGITTLFAAPWYLRNLLFMGNPVYPFLFGGPFWNPFRSAWFSRIGTGLLDEPWKLALAPWDATIFGIEGALGYEATIGPLLLALTPLLILNGRRSVGARPLLIFAGTLYLFWLLGLAESKLLWQTRLLFVAFPAFSMLAALALENLDALTLPQFSVHRFARAIVFLVLVLGAANNTLSLAADNPLRYLGGYESREAYLVRHLGALYDAAKFVNTQLPANAKVLFLWEPRGYYFQRDVQPDSILDQIANLHWRWQSVEKIAAALRAEGYTHVLLNRAGLDYHLQSGYDPLTQDELSTLLALESNYFKQIYGNIGLEIETRDGKRVIIGATQEPYAVYELIPR